MFNIEILRTVYQDLICSMEKYLSMNQDYTIERTVYEENHIMVFDNNCDVTVKNIIPMMKLYIEPKVTKFIGYITRINNLLVCIRPTTKNFGDYQESGDLLIEFISIPHHPVSTDNYTRYFFGDTIQSIKYYVDLEKDTHDVVVQSWQTNKDIKFIGHGRINLDDNQKIDMDLYHKIDFEPSHNLKLKFDKIPNHQLMNLLNSHLPVNINQDKESVKDLFSSHPENENNLVAFAIFMVDLSKNVIVDIPLSKNEHEYVKHDYDFCFYYPLDC